MARFTAEEAARLDAAARLKGMTFSVLMRAATNLAVDSILAEAAEPPKRGRKSAGGKGKAAPKE